MQNSHVKTVIYRPKLKMNYRNINTQYRYNIYVIIYLYKSPERYNYDTVKLFIGLY